MKSLLNLMLLPSFFLAGCGEQAGHTWTQLSDGSSWAQNAGDSGVKSAWRCWPKPVHGYVCLAAVRSRSEQFVRRTDHAELPKGWVTFREIGQGYSCERYNGFEQEEISNGEYVLMAIYNSQRWNKAEVNKIIEENKISGSAWFPCREILTAIDSEGVNAISYVVDVKDMF